jgi:hypothetical protein
MTQIEYQYKTYGGVNVVFIEVELEMKRKHWISLHK